MGVLHIEMDGSFPHRGKSFQAIEHGHAHAVAQAIQWLASEVLPVFARKGLFSYAVAVFSGVVIGFMGWGVWAHHMFAVGL